MRPRFTLNLSEVSQLYRTYTLFNYITTGSCVFCREFLAELVGPGIALQGDIVEISEDPECKMSLKRSDYGSTDEIVDEL